MATVISRRCLFRLDQTLLRSKSAVSSYGASRGLPSTAARPSRYVGGGETRGCTVSKIPALRTFATSSPAYKKKGGSDKGSSSSSSSSSSTSDEPDLGFKELQKSIDDAVARMKEDIAKLRTGGRFNPSLIEQLRVSLDNKKKETVRLGDIAQVIPKGGRNIVVLLGDESQSKLVSSAISSSNLSLNPQQDPSNPLQLNVPIPPPTRESRDAAVKEAKALMEKATQGIKNARQTTNKKLKDMGQKKVIQPDMLHSGLKEMEKIVQTGQKAMKDAWEAAQKALQQ